MSKYKSQNFFNTFKNAGKGFRLVLKSEPNIRVHCFCAVLVIIFALLLKLSILEICILLFAIAQVLTAEMINSGLEFGLDAVFKNRYSKLVGMAKDISAGAVMLATISSLLIGGLVFGNALINIYVCTLD